MAGSSDRYSRGNFAVAEADAVSPLDRIGGIASLLQGREGSLAFFVGIQAVLSGWLFWNNSLDLTTAACLSASLIVVARMFAALRNDGAAQTNLEVHPPLHDTVPVIDATRFETGAPIGIDEQSQTWADLTARISHEIRTPLNAVIGFADLMERELFGPLGNARYRDYAAHIKDSGEALLKSAEDTLALSSLLVAPSPDTHANASSLAELALDAWHGVAPQAHRRGVALDLQVAVALDVAGDRRALRQALSNLMIEAVQRADTDTRITVWAQADGDTVTIKVCAPEAKSHMRPGDPSLAICVARALLELQGTSLATSFQPSRNGWQASTVLDLAVQPDFFSAPVRRHESEARA